MAIIDLDEIIVPLKHSKLTDLLTSIDNEIEIDGWAGVHFDQHEHYMQRYINWSQQKSVVRHILHKKIVIF
jgi:hypothetical protein